MRTINKFTSWMLVAAMVGCLALPVQAETAANGSTTEETGSTVTTETTTSTENSTTEETRVPNEDVRATGLSPLTSTVLVIDPGHCKKHPGAKGNGLREEVVTMDISAACQSALDQYADITVYMTRDANSCCAGLGVGECLSARNNYAKKLDADFLVSMHINAGRSTGANVLTAYRSGYHDDIRKQTQAFGKVALKNLKAIGVANRGLLLRRSGSGNRYPNGRLADYYSIVRRGVVQEIPGVIIEHGYITSSSDCNKFFRTKAKRKKVGKTDAKSIISYFKLSKKLEKGTMEQDSDGTYYRLSDNKKAGGFIKQDGVWYYFDEFTGKMCRGFKNIGDDTIYLSPTTGEMVTGWFTVDGKRYLAKGNGAIVKGEFYTDGIHTYYFNADGTLRKKGYFTIEDNTYYADAKGYVAAGIMKIKGKKYGFDTETYQMLYGFVKINGNYYYFDEETGVMLKGWQKINGKYRYFSKKNGKMQKSKRIGKYYVNSKGIRTKKK